MTRQIITIVFLCAATLSVACSDDDTKGGKQDLGSQGDGGLSAACGALLSCGTTEYCENISPGFPCSGDLVSDAGVCKPNCSPVTCGGSVQRCVCNTFTCKSLGACTDCACLEKNNPTCSCQVGEGGVLLVHCAMP